MGVNCVKYRVICIYVIIIKMLTLFIWTKYMIPFQRIQMLSFIFHTFIISIVSSIFPYEWPVFKICCAYPEVSLLYFMALICSLYLVRSDRPVCPMYCKWHSLHFNSYTPDPTRPGPTRPGLLCLFSCSCCNFCCKCLFMVFLVLYAVFTTVFLKSFVTRLISFPV
jgi:hypothetical protein